MIPKFGNMLESPAEFFILMLRNYRRVSGGRAQPSVFSFLKLFRWSQWEPNLRTLAP